MKIKRNYPIWISGFIIALIILTAGFADEDTRFKKIREALNKFTILYPQQKVYLHMDKYTYWGGDVMWIKSYLVSGRDHLPDTLSTNLYVELISPFQTRVDIKRFKIIDGFGIGDFLLSDTLPEGLYQIRAYTTWMRNFDTEFYFEENFQLINPGYKKIISPKQARLNVKELKDLDEKIVEIDLQFLPEGGYLVSDLESTVAVKAINKLGKGADIKGTVYDENGNQITTFKTHYKGIGSFNLKPIKDVRYYAVVRYNNQEIKADLPEPLENGLVMHTVRRADKIIVNLATNKFSSNDPVANEVIITGQVGGTIYYSNIERLEKGKGTVEIPLKIFPDGILQLTTFSGRGIPLAERLVFVNVRGFMNISFTASDTLTDIGNKVVVAIRVTDQANHPLRANLSMAITRHLNEQPDKYKDNILSNLLLLSDLKGYVEDPLDYLTLSAEESAVALDLLMLTHGWRRFEWNDILSGTYPKIRHFEERGITIEGKITRDFFNLPLDSCKVDLSIMDEYNDVFTQYSSKNGTFKFENLEYYDTMSVKIEAWRPSGRKHLLILLKEDEEEEVTLRQGEYVLTTNSERDQKAYRRVAAQESKIVQKEKAAVLEARRNNGFTGLYDDPDFVMYSEDFHMVSGNILDVIKGRVPGVQVNGNRVVIRGVNTFLGSTEPLYLVNGSAVIDVGAITSIPIESIDRVEILKGSKTSLYGSRGANGVIAVYTKSGDFIIRGRIEFDMMGYNTPRKFYQPKFENGKEPAVDYTLHWEPEIVTDANGIARILFDKPLINGNYKFDIQGISYMGHVGYAEAVIGNE